MAKIGDIMQKLVMANPKTGMWFLSHMPASFWEKQGEKKALATFHEAAEKVSAYQKFLKEKGVNPEEIQTFEDFQKKVPIMDKENYILKNEIKNLCPEGKLDKMYTVSTSSGSTGKPSFWFRVSKQDSMLPKYWELFFLQNWSIERHSTLVIVTMDLGNWIAGELVSTTLKRLVLERKYPLTIATPGADVEQILDILKIGKNYDQIILIIYPSFIKSLFEKGGEKGINWRDFNIKLWVGGEKFPPFLKKYVLEKLDIKKEELNRIAFVYGTADAGGMGFSSPLSNLITRWSFRDDSLRHSIFGPTSFIPSLVQTNPLAYFIEEINGKLVITYNGGVPLIRYNLHDEGGVIPYPKIIEILQKQGYDFVEELQKEGYGKEKIWKWPFVYTIGRVDVVKIIGANIYPENIESTLYEKGTEEINSFRLKVEFNNSGSSCFYILVELKKDIFLTPEKQIELERKYSKIFLEKLLAVNADYRGAYRNDPKTATPVVKVYQFDQGPFSKKLATKAKFIDK